MPSQSNNEWYTPVKFVDAARRVMGGIDLDVSSCPRANETVQAPRYYSKEDNGLLQPFYGKVWCNPPYGRVNPEKKGSNTSFQSLFCKKVLLGYQQGEIEQAVLLLLGSSVFTRWFHPFWSYPICFLTSHIDFVRDDGSIKHFGFGSIFVYLGQNKEQFTQEFSKIGRIATSIDTHYEVMYQPSMDFRT